jgi:hypothetical protein
LKLVLATLALAAFFAAAVTKVDTGEATYGLAVSGGSLWVGGLTRGDVLRVDTRRGKVLHRVNAGLRIFNGHAWVSLSTGTAIRRL